MTENWEGVPGSTEHRTVGDHRAWCFQDGEWCYADDERCPCCQAVTHDQVWLPHEGTPEHEALVERLCEVQHDAYEAAAPAAGWQTQERSRKPWADVPEANKQTMRESVRAVLAALREREEADRG